MGFSHTLLIHHGRPCPYCGQTMRVPSGGRGRSGHPSFPTRDHVVPKSVAPAMGVLIVCRRCNLDKGNQLLDVWCEALAAKGDPRAKLVAALIKGGKHLRAPLPGRRPAVEPPDGAEG